MYKKCRKREEYKKNNNKYNCIVIPVCLILLAIIIVAGIVILFWELDKDKEIGLGEWLSFSAVCISLISSLVLGVFSYIINIKLMKQNKEISKMNNENLKLSNQDYFPYLGMEIISCNTKIIEDINNDKNITCNVDVDINSKQYKGVLIPIHIEEQNGNSINYKKTILVKVKNLSKSKISKIYIDQIILENRHRIENGSIRINHCEENFSSNLLTNVILPEDEIIIIYNIYHNNSLEYENHNNSACILLTSTIATLSNYVAYEQRDLSYNGLIDVSSTPQFFDERTLIKNLSK